MLQPATTARVRVFYFFMVHSHKRTTPGPEIGLVANTGGVNMTTFDVFLSVLLPAPSPALPEAMAGATSMEGCLATARATQLVDIVR